MEEKVELYAIFERIVIEKRGDRKTSTVRWVAGGTRPGHGEDPLKRTNKKDYGRVRWRGEVTE